MRMRCLVPALACLAAAPALFAAEGVAPVAPVKFSGFIDTAVSSSQGGLTESPEMAFWADAQLQADWAITDKVAAVLTVEFHNNSTAGGQASEEGTVVDLENAFGTWQIADGVKLKTGKWVSPVGFIAADAPYLYRINAGPVFSTMYTYDYVGVGVVYEAGSMVAEFDISNGTGEPYNDSRDTGDNRRGHDFAYTADVQFNLGEGSFVDAEFVYDVDGANNSAAGTVSGSAIFAGLNGLFQVSPELKAGGELFYKSYAAPQGSVGTTEDRSLVAMANYTLSEAASVTCMYQYVETGFDTDGTPGTHEYSLALLTTPAGSSKFGVNYEINYTNNNQDDGDAIGVAVEALYIIP